MSGECTLGFQDCLGCLAGILEDDEKLVATVIDDVAGAVLHGFSEEAAMIREHDRVAVAELADELRGALDIGEDERDRSMGEIWGQSLLQWDLGPNAGSRAGWAVNCKLAA